MSQLATVISLSAVLPKRARMVFMKALQDTNIDAKIAHDKLTRQPKFKVDSKCYGCSRIFYNERVEKCPKCGNVCRICAEDELEKLCTNPNYQEVW